MNRLGRHGKSPASRVGRHLLVLSLLVALLASGVSTSAEARDSRRIERARYDAPGGVSGIIGVSVTGTNIGAVRFPRGPERYLSVEVEDLSGFPVAAQIEQFTDPDEVSTDTSNIRYAICGATDKPVRIRPFFVVYVFIYEGPCEDGTPALATAGMVTAVFSIHP